MNFLPAPILAATLWENLLWLAGYNDLRELPPDGETPEGVARRSALTRVLLAALDGTPSAASLRLAGDLFDILALPDAAPDRRLLEERVWALCAHGRPSGPLKTLAEKVGIASKSHP